MMKFTVYEDKKKKWRWNLKTDNGKIIADSGEGYNRRAECLKRIKLIRCEVGTESIVQDVTGLDLLLPDRQEG